MPEKGPWHEDDFLWQSLGPLLFSEAVVQSTEKQVFATYQRALRDVIAHCVFPNAVDVRHLMEAEIRVPPRQSTLSMPPATG